MRLKNAWFVIYSVIAHHQYGGAVVDISINTAVDAANKGAINVYNTTTNSGYSTTTSTAANSDTTSTNADNSATTLTNAANSATTSTNVDNSATTTTYAANFAAMSTYAANSAISNATATSNSSTTAITTASYVNVTANSTVIVKPGAIFAASQSYLVRYGDSACGCTALCQSDPRCKHSCWITHPEIGYCRLTDFDYVNIVQLKRFSGYTAFDMPRNIFIGSDNMLYFKVNTKLTYQDAEKACASEENFQVGIYKTKLQLDFLKKIVTDLKVFWVNLNSIKNGKTNADAYAVWADGTPFNGTEISQLNLATLQSNEASTTDAVKFRYDGTYFYDRALSAKDTFAVLCQERIMPK